jgi:poly(A) polymerase
MVFSLLAKLKTAFAGRQLFLVGGAVRDALLGRETQDLDFATDCLPEETRARVGDWADSVWAVGEKFGTIGLEKAGLKAEITTFRADTYNGQDRHPTVAYGAGIAEDLARRDFTINAMARNMHTGELVDPFGGQTDLQARLVRFVGAPQDRIKEDPLRLLRAVRFCAQLDFPLEPITEKAVKDLAGEITRISWERIRDEFDLILLSSKAGDGIRRLMDLGLAHFTLRELETLRFPQNPRYHLKDVLEHTLDAVDLAPADKTLRWTMLLHDIAKPVTFSQDAEGIHFYRHDEVGAEMAAEILARLRQPADFSATVQRLIRNHLRVTTYKPEWSDSAIRRLMYDLGEDFDAAIEVAKADVAASHIWPEDNFKTRLANMLERAKQIGEAAELAKMKPLLNGEEVMELLGIAPGPLVGEVHSYLLSEQLEGNITTREQAIENVLRKYQKIDDCP